MTWKEKRQEKVAREAALESYARTGPRRLRWRPEGERCAGSCPDPCGVTSRWRGCRGARPSRGGPALPTVAGVGRVEGPQPPAPSLPGLLEPGVSRWEGPRGGGGGTAVEDIGHPLRPPLKSQEQLPEVLVTKDSGAVT